MNLTFSHIAQIVSGVASLAQDCTIGEVVYDSRKLSSSVESVFVALSIGNRNGHEFIKQAKLRGCRNYIIEQDEYLVDDGCNYILVDNSLAAYQALAKHCRSLVNIPIIGITGSNGKTIVKEWLSDCLSEAYTLVKTPKSYNSKIGVPESVMPIDATHELAIFEAGISHPDEMSTLQEIIQPTIGIFTTIGDAHLENFSSIDQLIREKLTLFKHSKVMILRGDDNKVVTVAKSCIPQTSLLTWGTEACNTIVADIQGHDVTITYQGRVHTFTIGSTNTFSFENLMHVISCAFYLGLDPVVLQQKLSGLSALPLRLQVIEGVRNMTIVNDSYTSDKQAFKYAIDYVRTHFPDRAMHIITSSSSRVTIEQDYTTYQVSYYDSTAQSIKDFVQTIDRPEHEGCVLLIKGKRTDRLERIANKLALQTHTTTLEINLSNIAANLACYLELVRDTTQVIAVIKASAYGSGSTQIGQYLSSLRVDYLAVALLDEGIELRTSGITKPILIFNYFYSNDASLLWKYDLEPEIYSLDQLSSIAQESTFQNKILKLHIKIDTGMNRLGFLESEFDAIASIINRHHNLKVESVFSHLSASDNPSFDEFTTNQFKHFDEYYASLSSKLPNLPWRHILNTAGIIRHPNYHLDAVRIGLGLYGIDETKILTKKLQTVLRLSTIVLQVKQIKAGDSLSYNRSFIAERDMTIGILGAGYADGIPRSSAKHGCTVYANGVVLPLIGTICMDVCFVDLSHASSISVGSTVEIFGPNSALSDLASNNDTIPYEVLSQIPSRIKRIYIED